jgi:hypothetical protein
MSSLNPDSHLEVFHTQYTEKYSVTSNYIPRSTLRSAGRNLSVVHRPTEPRFLGSTMSPELAIKRPTTGQIPAVLAGRNHSPSKLAKACRDIGIDNDESQRAPDSNMIPSQQTPLRTYTSIDYMYEVR